MARFLSPTEILTWLKANSAWYLYLYFPLQHASYAPRPTLTGSSPFIESCRALFRALGLNALYAWISHSRRVSEQPKIILRRSIWMLICRCALHIPPMVTMAVLIWINYSTLYIGPTFVENGKMDPLFLAGIQVAAKLLELMCIASLASIVMYAVRRELLGDGLPLGLLGSGQSFSVISSLWSSEFLSALPWGFQTRKIRRAMLLVLLAVAGIIASVVGPASAVLMLPRMQSFPAGGASFWMNGTVEDFWPNVVLATTQPGFCAYSNSTSYPVCPSSGYESLSQTLRTLNYRRICTGTGWWFAPQCQAIGAEGNREWNNFLVQSPQSLVPAVVNSVESPNWGPGHEQTIVSQPHAASIVWMQQFVYAWNQAALVPKTTSQTAFRWAYDIQTTGSTTHPFVRVRCAPGQNLSAKAENASFPHLYIPKNQNVSQWKPGSLLDTSIVGFDRNASAQIRTQWIQLPITRFGVSAQGEPTTGLLVELPWADDSRIAIGCTVAASWYNSTTKADRSGSYDSWKVGFGQQDGSGSYDSWKAWIDINRPVVLDEAWLRLLVAENRIDGRIMSPNTLERIFTDAGFASIINGYRTQPQTTWNEAAVRCVVSMMNSSWTDTELWRDVTCGKGNKGLFMELVVAMTVADGLSRYGSYRAFDIFPELMNWQPRIAEVSHSTGLLADIPISEPLTTGYIAKRMNIDVVGYSYYASTTSDYLALAVASLYLLLAGLHVVWRCVPWHREFLVSSSAWETITELLVLCQNSLPPDLPSCLENTSAGIQRFRTYQTLVKVRVVGDGVDAHAAKVQLVVADNSTTRTGEAANANDKGSTNGSGKAHTSSVATSISSGTDSTKSGSSIYRLMKSDATRRNQVRMDAKYG